MTTVHRPHRLPLRRARRAAAALVGAIGLGAAGFAPVAGAAADKDILVAFGVDVDAVAGWIGSYGGEDSPADISRGMFSGEVGTPRLLDLFEKEGIRTTWFIPGHSIETIPREMSAGESSPP